MHPVNAPQPPGVDARGAAALRWSPLLPVAASFALFGLFWGGFAVAVADLQVDLGRSHGGLGTLLSLALAGAAVANAVGGALTERWGTSTVLSRALGTWAVLLVVAALSGHPLALAVALVVVVTLGGLVDTAMNVAATARLARRPGALVRFHALFNTGAAAGAGGMGLAVAAGASWRWWWVGVAVAAVPVAVWAARTALPATGAGGRVPLHGAVTLLRRRGLLLVALAFAAGSMVEGGIDLWGVLFLRTHFAEGLALGATSAAFAYTVAALTRVVLGPVASRRGAGRGVAAGATAAAAGFVLLAVSPGPVTAGAGLVLAAGGISLCWPLLLAHASQGASRPAAVVGGMLSIGYLGFVVGPVLIGWVSAAGGLVAGLVLLAGASAFVATSPLLSGRRAPASSLAPER